MKPSDAVSLVLLGVLWDASCRFMQVGGAEFGAWALGGPRATGASLSLLPLLLIGGRWRELATHWRPIAIAAALERLRLTCCSPFRRSTSAPD